MKKVFGVILAVVALMVLLVPATQVSASTKVKVSGYFEADQPSFYESTTVDLNENISIETFTVIQSWNWVGDLQTEVDNPSILSATGTNRFNTNGSIWINQKASVDILFEGTIVGRTGVARIVGDIIVLSTDGNEGKARGQLIVTGISGDLEGIVGILIINDNTLEDNQVSFEGYVTFAD